MRIKLFIGVAISVFAFGLPGHAATFKRITEQTTWDAAYKGFPDVCKLADGDLLSCFYAGYGHLSLPTPEAPKGGRIYTMRSSDEGITWSEPELLIDLDGDDRDPSVMQTSDGTLICNFMTYYGRAEVPISFVVRVMRSFDNGQTWEEPVEVPSPFVTVTATSSPVIELDDGTLLMPIYGRDTESRYAEDVPGLRDRSVILRSTDGGDTWGDLVFIDENPDYLLQEPSIIQMKDDRLLCVMRPTATKSFSIDNGLTWSKPELFPHYAPCPYLLETREGVLLCAHRYNGTSVTISTDNAQNWVSPPFSIDTGPGGYPSMVELGDGRILTHYYVQESNGSSVWSNIRQAVFEVKSGPTIKLLDIDDYEDRQLVTQISSGDPDKNESWIVTAATGYLEDASTLKLRTLLGFDLSEIPNEAIITDVQLTMSVASHHGTNLKEVELRRIEHATTMMIESEVTWEEIREGVNWATPGGDYTTLLGKTPGFSDTNPKTFGSTPEFVAAVQDAVSSGKRLEMILMSPITENTHTSSFVRWCTDDAATASHPLLSIIYKSSLPGDANVDGVVDADDAAILASNWQKMGGATWLDGDFNADGTVDDIDATILAANWQKNLGGGSASLPEPTTMNLLVIGFVMLVARRLKSVHTLRLGKCI